MNKRKNTLAAIGSMICIGLAVLISPASALPVQAAAAQEETVMPMSDIIGWVFEVRGNKLYRRLYNYSTCNWIGNWIYVRDMPTK